MTEVERFLVWATFAYVIVDIILTKSRQTRRYEE